MGFLDKIFPLSELEKIKTNEESYNLLSEYLGENKDFVGFKNHSKIRENSKLLPDNINYDGQFFIFSLKLLSLDFLNKVSNDKRVKNLFYTSAAPPPGGSIDATSFRYKIIVEYY